ncbi:hypothetical protein [Tsukamurella soli]|uniref:hypothetical protein n=1 Tax=Tsukamurella soli TaxID=644556 RepID=UPI0031E99A7D
MILAQDDPTPREERVPLAEWAERRRELVTAAAAASDAHGGEVVLTGSVGAAHCGCEHLADDSSMCTGPHG